MKYWMYKCNVAGGPAGYWGEWSDLFKSTGLTEWGGSYSTRSAAVEALLDHEVTRGDVVVCYQTDRKVVVGFCEIGKVEGPAGTRTLWLRPLEWLATPLEVHKAKHGTVLEKSRAVAGRGMLGELQKDEMAEIVRLASASPQVLQGKPRPGGYRPPNRSKG